MNEDGEIKALVIRAGIIDERGQFSCFDKSLLEHKIREDERVIALLVKSILTRYDKLYYAVPHDAKFTIIQSLVEKMYLAVTQLPKAKWLWGTNRAHVIDGVGLLLRCESKSVI